jgi:hypothetical protein
MYLAFPCALQVSSSWVWSLQVDLAQAGLKSTALYVQAASGHQSRDCTVILVGDSTVTELLMISGYLAIGGNCTPGTAALHPDDRESD